LSEATSLNKAIENILAALGEAFADIDFAPAPLAPGKDPDTEQTCIRVEPGRLMDVMRFLHTDERCSFEQLCDLTCVDYLKWPKARDRFGVVYSLLSLSKGHRLWVKCFVNDPNPEVPSVTGIWHGADWMEREVFDMFGIRFTGHPDLRRILTWDAFQAHPLRKDYPLRGRSEREDFEIVAQNGA